ncbi:hypothetical protein J45TS6_09130 [Paenibacillus sp. J45TS6]|nr:hypothetical protein J45TS6_09130 [Paenibacillus sp. J45TS6]
MYKNAEFISYAFLDAYKLLFKGSFFCASFKGWRSTHITSGGREYEENDSNRCISGNASQRVK